MFINSAKLFQKCILIIFAVIVCLIVLQNLLNIFWFSSVQTNKKPVYSALKIIEKSKIIIENTISTTENNELSEASAILLWWTPFISEMEYTKNCGNSVCFFTGKREYLHHSKTKVN